MNEDRITEYKKSIMEAEDYPDELESINNRLQKKIRKGYRRRFISGLCTIVGVALLFTAVVNTSTVIAESIYRIPVIGDLAEYVKFDRGLQNAVKNEYIQEVNLEQESNGYLLKMPYVIADSKRLVLFFQLPENIVSQSDANEYQIVIGDISLEKFDVRSISYPQLKGKFPTGVSGLQVISIRTDEAAIPQDIVLPISLVKLYKEISTGTANGKHANEGSFVDVAEAGETILGSYEFSLHLNTFQEPITTVLNSEIQVLNETVFIQSITEYPTGIEIKVTAPNKGNAIISGLQFRGIDKKGNTWGGPEGTSPAVNYNYIDNSLDFKYYLENDYFSKASLTGLEIIGAGMFMKADQKITVDLLNRTMSPVISDLIIKDVRKAGDKAAVTFESTVADSMDKVIRTFDTRYEDLHSNVYDMTNYQNGAGYQKAWQIDDKIYYEVSVIWPEDNQVVLMRREAPVIKLENPVSISLNKQY